MEIQDEKIPKLWVSPLSDVWTEVTQAKFGLCDLAAFRSSLDLRMKAVPQGSSKYHSFPFVTSFVKLNQILSHTPEIALKNLNNSPGGLLRPTAGAKLAAPPCDLTTLEGRSLTEGLWLQNVISSYHTSEHICRCFLAKMPDVLVPFIIMHWLFLVCSRLVYGFTFCFFSDNFNYSVIGTCYFARPI